MVDTYFTSVLCNAMQGTSGAWKVITYLKQIILIIPGTNYRIRYDDEVFPDVSTWMTPVMKYNLLRYGENIFLDAQMRQYNQLN